MTDKIAQVKVSAVVLPLAVPISDAKVFTGRQRPMTEVAILVVEARADSGLEGVGFSYSKRSGGPGQYRHLVEIAPNLIGEDPNDIQRLHSKLLWAGASVGRSGLAVQAIAAADVALWDMKAKRAGLPLAKLLGAHRDAVRCYNTSGGFLHTPIDELLANAERSMAAGIGGVKIKVGHPDCRVDLSRVERVRERFGDSLSLMADANQQWSRVAAARMCQALDQYGLVWIEEPLDAYDAEGHADLARRFNTPVATGEMLTSVAEHRELIRQRSCAYLQPDAPRIGGVTPFLRVMALADEAHITVAPHFFMELHVHLAAACDAEPWLEHFDWLEPLFADRLEIRDGRILVPDRPGLGVELSDQARRLTVESTVIT
jgi:L-alanine-DL-glutamate epimerase-like enolase superfamily enzyme